jgi:hypothetical protein
VHFDLDVGDGHSYEVCAHPEHNAIHVWAKGSRSIIGGTGHYRTGQHSGDKFSGIFSVEKFIKQLQRNNADLPNLPLEGRSNGASRSGGGRAVPIGPAPVFVARLLTPSRKPSFASLTGFRPPLKGEVEVRGRRRMTVAAPPRAPSPVGRGWLRSSRVRGLCLSEALYPLIRSLRDHLLPPLRKWGRRGVGTINQRHLPTHLHLLQASDNQAPPLLRNPAQRKSRLSTLSPSPQPQFRLKKASTTGVHP